MINTVIDDFSFSHKIDKGLHEAGGDQRSAG